MIKLSNSSFKWSTDEQVYTPELHEDGSTLYCKALSYTTSGSGNRVTAIPLGFSYTKIYRMWGVANLPGGVMQVRQFPAGSLGDNLYSLELFADTTNVNVAITYLPNHSGKVYILYTK